MYRVVLNFELRSLTYKSPKPRHCSAISYTLYGIWNFPLNQTYTTLSDITICKKMSKSNSPESKETSLSKIHRDENLSWSLRKRPILLCRGMVMFAVRSRGRSTMGWNLTGVAWYRSPSRLRYTIASEKTCHCTLWNENTIN